MEIVSACPLPVGSIVWQAWSGAIVLSVACKATFRLRSIESPLADEQDPITEVDRYWYDDPRQPLRAATDLVPYKRRAEIVVVGHAHAPHGTPVRSMVARLCVAGIDKTIEMFADRVFSYEGRLREGPPFVKMPLLWQYAAGGPDTPNPVGIRQDAPPDTYGQRLIPRFQPPGLHITHPDQVIPSIGFGPIAPTWPSRLEKLYHHAATWDHQRWRERPLPRDIDAAYFNAAPPDQQVDAISAEERIVLENLHPELGRVATNLSPVTPDAVVERPGRPVEAVPFVCDTMCIDSDRGVCAVTWRARIILDAPHAPGRVIVRATQAPQAAYATPAGASSTPEQPPGAPAPRAPRPGSPPAPPPPGHDDFTIERCAEVAASIARRPSDTVKILGENGISDDDWDAIEHHWAQTLKKEAAEHESDRLAAYDRAYVACLEEERGPITPDEYARLVIHERDRGALTRALRDLGLPWGCTPRILRVFAERMKADPALAERVRAAMAE